MSNEEVKITNMKLTEDNGHYQLTADIELGDHTEEDLIRIMSKVFGVEYE